MHKPTALIALLPVLALLVPAALPSRAAAGEVDSHTRDVAAEVPARAGADVSSTTNAGTAEPEKEKSLIGTEANTAVWVLIIFVILLVILYKTAWKNVLAGLKSREERIRKDIAEAEANRAKTEASLKDYSAQLATAEAKARDMINQATLQAQRSAEQVRTRAQEETEQMRERALKDIDDARKQALNEIYEQAAVLATSVAEKILRRNLNPDDQRDLVNRSVEQIGNVARN